MGGGDKHETAHHSAGEALQSTLRRHSSAPKCNHVTPRLNDTTYYAEYPFVCEAVAGGTRGHSESCGYEFDGVHLGESGQVRQHKRRVVLLDLGTGMHGRYRKYRAGRILGMGLCTTKLSRHDYVASHKMTTWQAA